MMSSEETEHQLDNVPVTDTTANTPTIDSAEEIHSDEESDERWDFEGLTKEELLATLREIRSNEVSSASRNKLKDIKSAFTSIYSAEKKAAFDEFIASGEEKDGFDYREEHAQNFFDLLAEINDIRRKEKIQKDEQRIENTKKKDFLLNQLRDLVEGNEESDTFNQVKEIQKTWKETGAVSQAAYHEQNRNFHGLLDRYYSRRSIYFELKDLDRQKNEARKLVIIEKVEGLIGAQNTLNASKELNSLHEEYKAIGPVPQEKSEPMWQRLKEATDQVRAQREQYVKEQQVILEANLEVKKEILIRAIDYAETIVDSVSEWKTLTEEVLELQQEWKEAGPMPNESRKELSDAFWMACRIFFNHKQEYFSKLDEVRKNNLEKKKALISKVEKLKDSEDFATAANEIKRIQAEWKKVGPAPRAQHESIYQEFRGHCDHFFNRRSAQFEERELEYQENLVKKEAICARIEELNEKSTKAELTALLDEYFAIGYVPRDDVSKAQARFSEATTKFINSLQGLEGSELQELKLTVELGAVKGTPKEAEFVQKKTGYIKQQISGLNEEITTLKNNLEFFARSKNIDSLRADVDKKVLVLKNQLTEFKEQLKILR